MLRKLKTFRSHRSSKPDLNFIAFTYRLLGAPFGPVIPPFSVTALPRVLLCVYNENKPVGNFMMGLSVLWCPRSTVCSLSSDVDGGVSVGVGAWTMARGEQRGSFSALSAAHMHIQTVRFTATLMRYLHPGSQHRQVLDRMLSIPPSLCTGVPNAYTATLQPTILSHIDNQNRLFCPSKNRSSGREKFWQHCFSTSKQPTNELPLLSPPPRRRGKVLSQE